MNGSTKDGTEETLAVRLKRFPDHRYSAILLPAIGCFLYAALLLLFCTRNSPLFVFQSWIDPNIYMDTARAMTKGTVLYRDVFDHKGPLLYLVFIVFSFVSKDTMAGLYLLQSLTLGITLLYLYRMALLFVPKSASFWICAVFPFFLLNNLVYFQGGGSAEELLLPCFMGGLYYLCASFRNRSKGIPMEGRKESVQAGAFFPLGIFSGIVLAVKLNLTVFFIVGCGFLFFSFLLRKDWKLFFQALWRYFAGILIAILPCIFYIAVTKSLSDFFEVYVKFNWMYSSPSANPSEGATMLSVIQYVVLLNLAAVLCGLIGITVMAMKEKSLSKYGYFTFLCVYVFTFLAINISLRECSYMYIPLLCFTGLGEIGCGILFAKIRRSVSGNMPKIKWIRIIQITAAISVSLLIILSNSLYRESNIFPREQSGVERIANAIDHSWSTAGNKNAPSILLLNSGDLGFFGLTKSVPDLRVFYLPIINYDSYPELLNDQIAYITEGLPDFVITIGYSAIDEKIVSSFNPDYVLLDYQTQTIEGTQWYMYLYSK